MKTPKLKFAYKAKSIEYVYRVGPHSCMKGSKRVRAYEGPDLAVAYIRDNKRIVARSVVWPKKKQYYTIYHEPQKIEYSYFLDTYPRLIGPNYCAVMRNALHQAGYRFKRLKGAKFSKIPMKRKEARGYYKGFMVPSVDGARGFKIGRKYLTIQ